MSDSQIHDDLADMVGSVLANTYRLDALIGEGGMGAVFKGRDVLQRRDVAIKVLHPDFSRDVELSKRFEREAKSAQRLNHPNCIQIIEFGETQVGMKYLVMQLLEGTELQNIVDGAVEPVRAVELILQVLRGLEHAHSQGVVHRDLKPQNIFVTREPDGSQVLKLVDFGIAKIVAGDGAQEQMTRAGMVFGTPQYMSPEQALGLDIDPRADLYAVGILLYQLVTGRLPFNSDDPVALIRMQVSTEPPQLPNSVPNELAAVIMRLLAKQKEQRFPDARTVRIALERWRDAVAPKNARNGADPLLDVVHTGGTDLSGLVSVAKPLPDALRPRPMTLVESMLDEHTLRRRPWFRALVAVLALGVVGSLVYFVALRDPATTPEPVKDDGKTTAEAKQPEPKQPEPPRQPEPAPPARGPSAEELAAIDELVTQNKLDEAAKRLADAHAKFPDNAEVRWREASVQAQRGGDPAAAIALYAEALKLDEELAHNLGFHAQVDGLLRRKPVSDAAIDLAVALGPQGRSVLAHYINDADSWATYDQRRKIRDALGAGAPEVDKLLNTRRDLEQVAQSPTPCQTMKAALSAAQAEPKKEFVPALQAAAPPAPKPTADDAEKAACKELAPLLATVRTGHAQAFPEAFPQPKKKKKKRRR
jgi:serine/threonine protein kinase